jgi:hypothetical protein
MGPLFDSTRQNLNQTTRRAAWAGSHLSRLQTGFRMEFGVHLSLPTLRIEPVNEFLVRHSGQFRSLACE